MFKQMYRTYGKTRLTTYNWCCMCKGVGAFVLGPTHMFMSVYSFLVITDSNFKSSNVGPDGRGVPIPGTTTETETPLVVSKPHSASRGRR